MRTRVLTILTITLLALSHSAGQDPIHATEQYSGSSPDLFTPNEVVPGSAIDGTIIDSNGPIVVTASHDGKEIDREEFATGGTHSFLFDTQGLSEGDKVLITGTGPYGIVSNEVTLVTP